MTPSKVPVSHWVLRLALQQVARQPALLQRLRTACGSAVNPPSANMEVRMTQHSCAAFMTTPAWS